MIPSQQNQSDQSELETDKSRQKYAKPPNMTAVWIVVMLWPPLALAILAMLSVVVNYLAAQSARAVEVIGGSERVIASTTPGWADSANMIILVCVGLALLGGAVNFSIGLFMLYKKRFRSDFLS